MGGIRIIRRHWSSRHLPHTVSGGVQRISHPNCGHLLVLKRAVETSLLCLMVLKQGQEVGKRPSWLESEGGAEPADQRALQAWPGRGPAFPTPGPGHSHPTTSSSEVLKNLGRFPGFLPHGKGALPPRPVVRPPGGACAPPLTPFLGERGKAQGWRPQGPSGRAGRGGPRRRQPDPGLARPYRSGSE